MGSGHGVYFALQGDISLGNYAVPTNVSWKNSEFPATKIAALCEIVNAPSKFTSSSPYLVVPNMTWIQTRYLLVQASQPGATDEPTPHAPGSTISLDPKVVVLSFINAHADVLLVPHHIASKTCSNPRSSAQAGKSLLARLQRARRRHLFAFRSRDHP